MDTIKPKKLNYFFASLWGIVLLAGIYFPPIFPYYKWLISSFGIPSPLLSATGWVFYWFFSLLVPIIIIAYFTHKYSITDIGKKIFIKLPLAILLFSIIGAIISFGFVGLTDCSGEDCLGFVIAPIIFVPSLVLLSLLAAIAVYLLKTRRYLSDSLNRIIDFLGNKVLLFIIVTFPVIFLLFSAVASYDCKPIKSERYYNYYNYCQPYKINANSEKEFFLNSPKDFNGLTRVYVQADYDGITTYGGQLPINNYKKVYIQNYSYPGKACIDNDCFTSIIYFFQNANALETGVQNGISHFEKTFSGGVEYGYKYRLEKQNLDEHELVVAKTETSLQYVWVSNNTVVQIETNPKNQNKEMVRYFLEKYPPSTNIMIR